MGVRCTSDPTMPQENSYCGTAEDKEEKGFLKKFGKWAPIIGGAWIVLNIVLPLALLRIPAVQKVLVAVGDKLPFDIPGIG